MHTVTQHNPSDPTHSLTTQNTLTEHNPLHDSWTPSLLQTVSDSMSVDLDLDPSHILTPQSPTNHFIPDNDSQNKGHTHSLQETTPSRRQSACKPRNTLSNERHPNKSLTSKDEIQISQILNGKDNEDQNTTLDVSIHDGIPITNFKTKAACQIENAIGTSQVLLEFDSLRASLKRKATDQQRFQPSTTEREHYNKTLAILHTQVLSTKYKLKDNVKAFETDYHQRNGTFPSREVEEYGELRKKTDFIKKILCVWHTFNLA